MSGAPDVGIDLVELFRGHAARTPDAMALAWFDRRARVREQHTLAGYLTRCEGLAGALLAKGCRPGEPVLLLHPPGMAFFEAFFACLIAGIVPVPAFPPDPLGGGPRHALVERVCAHIGITTALTTARYETARKVGGLRRALKGGRTALRWIASDRLAPGPTPPPHRPAPDDVAFMQFTSGSTSDPRGVAITHRNLMHQLRTNGSAGGVSGDSRLVVWLPQYHDFGLVNSYLCGLYHGCPVWMCSPLDFLEEPSVWLEMMHRVRATHSASPDFGYAYAVRRIPSERLGEWDLSALTCSASGGEPIRPATIEAFAEKFAPCGLDRRALYGGYGLAEHTVGICGAPSVCRPFDAVALRRGRLVPVPASDPRAHALASSGRPFEGVALRIVDPETTEVLGEGRIGEIWAASPSVAAGYVNDPESTARVFGHTLPGDDRAWLRTGDLGALLDGDLFVTGRLKDLVIVRGRNVFPADVEDRVRALEHPAIRPGGVAVVGFEADGEERLAVLVELRDGRWAGQYEAISEAVRGALAADGLHPGLLHLLPKGALPKTTSGKLRRRRCAELIAAGEPVSGRSPLFAQTWVSPPTTPDADDALVSALAERSDLPPAERRALVRAALADWIGAEGPADDDASLAGLGLDSLRVAALVEAVERATGRALSRPEMFELRTVGQVVDWVLAAPDGPAAFGETPTGPVPATAFQRLIHHDHGAAPGAVMLFEVDGPVEPAHAREALAAVMARHDLLRARFETGDGLIIVPGEAVEAPLTVIDGADTSDRQAAIEAHLRRPFDVTRETLRAVLSPGAPTLLGLALHHLIYDGVSSHALLAEWLEALGAAATGDAIDEAPSPSFLALAAGQQPPGAERVAWWREALDGAPWPTAVPNPVEGNRRLVPAGRFVMDAEAVQALEALARRCETSLDGVVAAAWARAMGEALGQDAVVCMHPVSLRTGLTRAVCGPLIEDVLLALPADRGEAEDRVRRVGAVLSGALRHADVPFAAQRALLPGDDSDCPVIYAFYDWELMCPQPTVRALRRGEAVALGPLTVRPVPLAAANSDRPFDYFASAEREGGRLSCGLRVAEVRVGAAFGADIVERWRRELAALAAMEGAE